MIFSSVTFFIFFTVVFSLMLILNSLAVKNKANAQLIKNVRHVILLIASYIFYGWWDWRFCFLMCFMTIVAYYCAKQIENQNLTKLHIAVSIVTPLLVLAIFKYFNFFTQSFCSLFGIEGFNTLNIILPVGISFYTFQSMSYTIDVMRKKISAHSFLDVALYISFFPQLVAGPIVRAEDFMPQLKSSPAITIKNFCEGIQIFAFGLFKKIVIADHLSLFVDDVFSNPTIFSSPTIILAIISYSIQIYFDFSGYSDMAIGTAKCLGYHFNRNFNMPYISRNVSEFWKRWHISLSSWLQEYLYIPLGGNRKGVVRTYINLMTTMLLGGLWHGAKWTFVIWGFLHGAFLCLHKAFRAIKKSEHSTSVISSAISILFTYILVCIGWVFFRAETVQDAFIVIKKLFIWQDGITQIYSWSVVAILIIIISYSIAVFKSKKHSSKYINGFYPVLDLNKFSSLVIFFVFIGLIIALAFTGSNPFIYFQF